jgi:hypothetical protein
VTVAGSSFLVRCFLLCGVLFLVVPIYLLVYLVLSSYDLRVEERLSVSAKDPNVKTRSGVPEVANGRLSEAFQSKLL